MEKSDKVAPLIFVTRKWPPAMGGMETYCFKLVEQLRRRRHVELLALPGRGDGSVPNISQLLRFALVTTYRLLFGRPLPDLIHVADMASWPFGFIARVRHSSIRIMLSAHGTDVSYGRRGGWRGRIYRIYLRLGAAIIGSARVIANSEATAEACRQAGFRDICIVPLASDLRAPGPSLPAPGSNLLFAGRLIRRKGLLWFVENVLPLLPRGTTVDVAGSLWSREEEAALAHERVNYLGVLDREALARAYSGALCVIVPNIEMANGEFEGFGLVAVEAAAAGGVVVASDTGGLRSAVKNGLSGILVEAGNAAAWASKIVEVRGWDQARRNEFLAASIAEVRAHFSWERVARQTEAIYDQ